MNIPPFSGSAGGTRSHRFHLRRAQYPISSMSLLSCSIKTPDNTQLNRVQPFPNCPLISLLLFFYHSHLFLV